HVMCAPDRSRHPRKAMFEGTRGLWSAILSTPRPQFFPLGFTEGTAHGKRHTPTQSDGDGHRVWRHSVCVGPRHCPVLALAGDGLVDQRRCVLADRLTCNLGCRSHYPGGVFVKGSNCARLGMAHSDVDVALFPALADGAGDPAIVGGGHLGWARLCGRRMGATAFG